MAAESEATRDMVSINKAVVVLQCFQCGTMFLTQINELYNQCATNAKVKLHSDRLHFSLLIRVLVQYIRYCCCRVERLTSTSRLY
jgi:hypothetical protein